MVAIWLKLDVPQRFADVIASIQEPLTCQSFAEIRITASNLRDIRTSEPDEERPGKRIAAPDPW